MVTLVGAGPGDFELMTLKGMESLKNADVVLYDRLVGDEIISNIPEKAEKINVGKQANNHPIPQDEINKLILEKAKDGLNVVRLKGGDPFVFGRGGEELELLVENDVEFEVVPGISSSVAAGMYAGIPVTHRDYASSIHVITGHVKADGELEINFEALAKLKGTLVFMMSVSALGDICKGCLQAGMDKNTPAAIIENATLNIQRKFMGTVETLQEIAEKNEVVSPSVIIIGEVCALSSKFDWFGKKPLLNKSVVVTRAKSSESKLTKQLKKLGAKVVEMPCIHIEPILNGNRELEKAVAEIENYNWLVFTSGKGVELFFEYLKGVQIDIRKLHHMKIAVVGSETKREVMNRGLTVEYIPGEYNSDALAKGLLQHISANEKVLIARAKIGADSILNIFKEANVDFENVAIYDTIHKIEANEKFIGMISENQVDYVMFTSASTVEGFVKSVPNVDFRKIKGICIGEKTAKAAESYGMQVFASGEATIISMIEKLKELCK